ncbi:fibronectin [Bacillus cereus]|uniref:Fibronectin n=1 Tax=Bacillus cereus TaxID=1396 RepID=A0A2C1DA07_BACCE|nr:fibronectin [Bacillus cereus]
MHLPPKIGVSHLHIFEEGVFCQKTINDQSFLQSYTHRLLFQSLS